MSSDQVARALGWTGIGLGLAEIVAPNWLTYQLGTRDHAMLLRLLGAREILSGIGILAPDDPKAGTWARVAGDVMDAALLGIAATRTTRRGRFAAITAAILAIGAADFLTARRLQHA